MLQVLGDLPGARAQRERALQISEAALGPDHPAVGNLRRDLDGVPDLSRNQQGEVECCQDHAAIRMFQNM